MKNDAVSNVFEDFNMFRVEAALPPVKEASRSSDEILIKIRDEAWTDGYLTGCHKSAGEVLEGSWAAKLVTFLHELDLSAANAVSSASLAVADIVIQITIAVASDNWPRSLPHRVQLVSDRIKPAMTIKPEFMVRDESGTERHFGDFASLSRALDDGILVEDIRVQWQRGEAIISRTALMDELRDAIIPFWTDFASEQNVGKRS